MTQIDLTRPSQGGDRLEDLLCRYHLNHIAFTFTNRCNLRCVYCPQGSHPDDFHADTPDQQINSIINFVLLNKIPIVSIGYYGETTMISGWAAYCERLLNAGVNLRIVSNFSYPLETDELEALARFARIEVSIDTVDPAALKRIRKAADVRLIVYNTQRLQAHAALRGLPMPEIVWTGVLCEPAAVEAVNLVAMAKVCGVKNVHFNDLAYISGSPGGLLNVIDLPVDSFLNAFAGLEEARIWAARAGVNFDIPSVERFEARALAEAGPEIMRSRFRRLTSVDQVERDRRVIIWGAGQSGKNLFKILTARGISIVSFIDSHVTGEVCDCPVTDFQTYLASAHRDDLILVASRYFSEIEAALLDAALDNYLLAFHFQSPKRNARAEISTVKVARQGIQGAFDMPGDEIEHVPTGLTRLCVSPWTEMYFDPKGEVYSCCQRGAVMGVLEHGGSIAEIFANERFQKLRRQLLSGDDLDAECARCSIGGIVEPSELHAKVRQILGQ